MIEPRLRAVLLGIAAAGFAGMIAELLLVEHWALPWQITPFTLSAVAIVSIFLFALRPRVLTAVLLRLVMASVIAGAALGMYQHVAGNAAFEREIHVGASTGAVLWGCPARRGSGHGARRSCHGRAGRGRGDLEIAGASRRARSGSVLVTEP